jgi:hypothetical protein
MGSNSSWALATPNKLSIQRCASGSHCWVTGGPFGIPIASEMSWVQSPQFDFTYFTSDPLFSFTFNAANTLSIVGINVQLSTDMGQSW